MPRVQPPTTPSEKIVAAVSHGVSLYLLCWSAFCVLFLLAALLGLAR